MKTFDIMSHNYKSKLFFILSFVITWTAGGILIYQSRTSGQKDLMLLFLAYMGPMFAALITMLITRDQKVFRDFFGKAYEL